MSRLEAFKKRIFKYKLIFNCDLKMIYIINMSKKIHIHFGGCGGHYGYFLGISSILQQLYDLDDVIFSGMSAGCLSSFFLATQLNIDNLVDTLHKNFIKEINTYKLKSFYNFIPTIEKFLKEEINKDKNLYKKANNKLHCHLTSIPKFKNIIINQYNDNYDLIECITTSCHIPIYSNCLLRTFRNDYYLDGGLSRYIHNDDIIKLSNDYILIEFDTHMYRNINATISHHLFIGWCEDHAYKLFNLGKLDMLNNLSKVSNHLKYSTTNKKSYNKIKKKLKKEINLTIS